MTCTPVFTERGTIFVCGRYEKYEDLLKEPEFPCYICGRPATVLCDAPAGYEKTCDKPMCREHSHNIGKDTDVCQDHYNDYEIEQAKENRLKLSKGWWPIQDNTYCPACKSEEHAKNAAYCKLCGAKLKEVNG